MKKAFIYGSLAVFLILLIVVVALIGKYIEKDADLEIIKVEVYENAEERLTIDYYANGRIGFVIETIYSYDHIFVAGADFINENTAVFDGTQAFPAVGLYYELFFGKGYVDVFNNSEFISRYMFVKSSSNVTAST